MNSEIWSYIYSGIFIVSIIFYLYIFRKSRTDNNLVLIVGGKTGLAGTVLAWVILLIDFCCMSSADIGITPLTIIIAIICGIAIITNLVMAVRKSKGLKNRIFAIYGHFYTVLLALFVVLLIAGLFTANWISRKKNWYGKYVDSNDFFSIGIRALRNLLLRITRDFEI